jgi:branched-chain amino acid transport system permease protein
VTYFLTLLIQGISLGFVFGLIALGFAIVFKAARVVNFSHAAIVMLGAFVVGRLHDSIGFWPALLCGLAATAVFGALVFGATRLARRPDPGLLTIMTLGVDIMLGSGLSHTIAASIYFFGDPWSEHVIALGSSTIYESRVAAAVAAILIVAAFGLAFRFSGWGIAMRAASEDPGAAALMGIRLGRVTASAWAVAGLIATVAGIFFLTIPSGGLTNNSEAAILAAFPAAIIGGLDSVLGAVVGGLVVGLATTFVDGYQQHLTGLGQNLSQVVPYAVMLVVLLARPTGLFGTRELHRV